MLEIGISNLIKNFGFKNVLNGASIEIMSGDQIGLVGRNGCGKSTILKIIAGIEKADQGTIGIRSGAQIGYLEQIPELVDVETTVHDVLMEPFEQLMEIEKRMRTIEGRMASADGDALEKLMRSYAFQQSDFETRGGYEIEESLGRICTGFGLTELLDRPFNVLSGGQKTIVVLARTLLRQPDILLLDEPTNHLDMRMLSWFEGYLAKYHGTVLVVSHDRYFLDAVTTKTVILEDGECTEYHGNYTKAQEDAEKALLAEFEQYKNQQKQIEAMHSAIRRYREWGALNPSNKRHFKKVRQLELRLEKMEMINRPQLEKPKIPLGFEGRRAAREVIRLENLDVSIGELSLIRGASFTLRFKDRTCLLGDNGSGKTTLIRRIMQAERNDFDSDIFIAPSAKIGYIEQEIRFEDANANVIAAFRAEFPCPEGIARGILAKYFFTGENIMKRVSALSGGEKVLLKLAILTQKEINLLILDEPTNHIDIETREMLEGALDEFGGTILFISHDRYFIRKLASRVIAIEGRKLNVYDGGFEDYLRRGSLSGG